MELRKISLKYEGRCVKCGRSISAGVTAYWEKDRGVWHVDCAMPHREKGHASKSLWAVIGGIVILAFVFGGFTVGPILAPNVTMTTESTITTERLITVTETSIIASPVTQPAMVISQTKTTPSVGSTIVPKATTTVKRQDCDPAYPTVCIFPPPPDLDCKDIPYRRFKVLPPDPHRFDGDGDGIGCEW